MKTNRQIVASPKQLKGSTGIATHDLDEEGRKRFNKKIEVAPMRGFILLPLLGPPPSRQEEFH